MTTYTTLEAAAKAAGAEFGVQGGPGGWLRYTLPGTHTLVSLGIQGWNEYGQRLVRRGVILALAEDGTNVQRQEVPGAGVTTYPYSRWRKFAARFEIVAGKQRSAAG